ncbi:hypothetical protein Gpo141_00002502 [Globisporangium polare]
MMMMAATQPSSGSPQVDGNGRRGSVSVVRTAEDVGYARVTSVDHIALQFYWQGYDAYAQCRNHESVVPCFFNAHCAGQDADAEFVHIVPVDEVRSRAILDEMRVQLVSVSSGKYLRATRVSKFLKWSSARDEQTVFQIQVLDRKPLTQGSKFTLASCFWPGYSIGFGQKLPLGGSRDLAKAIGFLTLEKKKHQPPLLFPIRFRAVLREFRNLRPASSPSHQEAPTAFVTTSDMVFIDEEHEPRVAGIPLATIVPVNQSVVVRGSSGSDDGAEPEDEGTGDACPYCGVHVRQRVGLLAHIRDYHGDWLQRPSVEGSFCVHCGQRRADGVCSRCSSLSS